MDTKMNMATDGKNDVLQGKWHEFKGQVKQQWGKLTDDDVSKLSGKQEELAGVLQRRYGYAKGQAELEINNWVRDHDKQKNIPTPPAHKA